MGADLVLKKVCAYALVLEGDLSFGELNLKAGDFHVATPSSSHPPGRTVNGCLVHVIMSLDQH